MEFQSMTPKEIVNELDRFVIGQDKAKRAVAIALRNRWRRMQVAEDLRSEIFPKNILMIGSTGVGKTEISRRLAALIQAPFVKVEATKFTEVGYVGRDVDSIVRDLMEIGMRIVSEKAYKAVSSQASEYAEERVLEAILKQKKIEPKIKDEKRRSDVVRRNLREEKYHDYMIEIEVSALPSVGLEIVAPPGMEEMTGQLQSMFQNMNAERLKKKKIKVVDALRLIQEEEAAHMVNEEDLRGEALELVEQNGIIFIDEIDKVIKSTNTSGAEVSREGVQRDLLPLLEGTTVNTKYGNVKTDHILFIASGAFMEVKPSDMISELQGRLPIQVKLQDLSEEDFRRILLEPEASLIKQYQALLATESVQLKILDSGVKRLAAIAFQINQATENIGARRLYTILEHCLEEIMFDASDVVDRTVKIDVKYVDNMLKNILSKDDLSRWIL
jgi:ATP-dependent HslUV protease ATP-binding subunit HslU